MEYRFSFASPVSTERVSGLKAVAHRLQRVDFGDRTDRKEITVGGGHMSGVFDWWHFGLGSATEAELRVIWPDGTAGPWQKVTPGFWLLERDKDTTPWQPGSPAP